MKCPACGEFKDRVLESRDGEDRQVIRRRRECLLCQHRYTTYERVEPRHLLVVKKTGERVPYDRSKLASGLYKACEKRPLSAELIEQTITSVEREILAQAGDEVKSEVIGEIVMSHLASIDEVAYVRFASVYRSFTTTANFEQEIAALKRTRQP